MTDAAQNPFQLWLAEAVREAGAKVPGDMDPLGLSFEADGRVARILPHADEDLAVIEVTAIALDDSAEDDVARLAVQLLRLDHEARFEHGWRIVLDDNDRLNVTTTVAVPGTRGNELRDILYDGVERARALSAVVAGLLGAGAPEPETTEMPGTGAIRG